MTLPMSCLPDSWITGRTPFNSLSSSKARPTIHTAFSGQIGGDFNKNIKDRKEESTALWILIFTSFSYFISSNSKAKIPLLAPINNVRQGHHQVLFSGDKLWINAHIWMLLWKLCKHFWVYKRLRWLNGLISWEISIQYCCSPLDIRQL